MGIQELGERIEAVAAKHGIDMDQIRADNERRRRYLEAEIQFSRQLAESQEVVPIHLRWYVREISQRLQAAHQRGVALGFHNILRGDTR